MWKIKFLIFVLVIGSIAYVGYEVYRIGPHYAKGKQLTFLTKKFERDLENPSKKVLVLGDSNFVGVGAYSPETSFIGRIALDYPEYAFVNLAENGSKVEDVRAQLRKVEGQRFDRVIISIGGNDILYFSNLNQLRGELKDVLEDAAEISDMVIFMSGTGSGKSDTFPHAMGPYIHYRTRKIQAMYAELGEETDAYYFDVSIADDEEDIFALKSELYLADDKFHLSSDGYKLWYDDFLDFLTKNTLSF